MIRMMEIENCAITSIFLNKDVEPIEEVIGMFTELLSAWREVDSKPESQIQPVDDGLYREKKAVDSRSISS